MLVCVADRPSQQLERLAANDANSHSKITVEMEFREDAENRWAQIFQLLEQSARSSSDNKPFGAA